MQRRPLLTAIATLSTAGCLDRSSSGPQDELPSSDDNEGAYAGLEIVSVYPREVERKYISYEYVELKNRATSAVPLDGVTVEYDDTTSYEFSSLDVETGATVVLASRARTETTLATAPPAYIRSAEFGQTKDTSVLSGEGTVVLKAPDGSILDKERYDVDRGEWRGASGSDTTPSSMFASLFLQLPSASAIGMHARIRSLLAAAG